MRRASVRRSWVSAAALVVASAVLAPATTAPAALRYATTPTAPGPVDLAALPLGDGYISTTPRVGYVDSCQTTFGATGGASVVGPWIDTATGTWDSLTKTTVEGSTSWPDARYSVTVRGARRIITGDDEPVDHSTGVFPIATTDPAYRYDRNPNRIEPQSIDWSLPVHPRPAARPTCTSGGTIGILDDGVVLFNALDGEGRTAVAHELLDGCGEHPQMDDVLHHHDVPACLIDRTRGRSTLVGYALDGYGIYVERNADGSLVTNAQLDACHGRTSRVLWDGKEKAVYHYDATVEYPYTIGCFHGTPVTTTTGTGAAPAGPGGGLPQGPGGARRPPGPGGGPPGGGPGGPGGGPALTALRSASSLFTADLCGEPVRSSRPVTGRGAVRSPRPG